MSTSTIHPLKRCTKCGNEFPATTEYFATENRVISGLQARCRQCNLEYKRHYNQRITVKEDQCQYRQHPNVKQRKNQCERERRKRPEVKERLQDYNRAYHQRPEVKDHHRVWRRNYCARKCSLPDTLTTADIACMMTYWNGCCAVCGRMTGLWHTIALDHWIALTDPRPDNPGTVPTNIVPLCHARPGVPAGEPCCNQSKRNKDAEVWLIERFGKHKAAAILKRIETYFEWVKRTRT